MNVGWLVAAMLAATGIVAFYLASLTIRRRRLERRLEELDRSVR